MAEIRVEQKRRGLGWLWLLLALLLIGAAAYWFWYQHGGRVDTSARAAIGAVQPRLALAGERLHRAPLLWTA